MNPEEVWYRAMFGLVLIVWHTRPDAVRALPKDDQLAWVRTTMIQIATGQVRRGEPGA